MVKVSVIMPVYNTNPEFFTQAVNSALSQTLEDIELIIVDDGSDDYAFKEKLNDISKSDKRIRLLSKPHEGSGQARNLGISLSNGEKISFLDSDDFYPDNTILKTLSDIIDEKNVLIAGGTPIEYKQDGTFASPYFNYGNLSDYFSDRIAEYSDYQFPWWYWCFMYDAKFIKTNNFFFPKYLRYQDPIWFVKVMHSAKSFYALSKNTYVHRDRGSLHTLNKTLFEQHVNAIAELLKYSDNQNLDRLHNLLYSVFFSYDINLFQEVSDLTEDDKKRFVQTINSAVNKDKIM